MKLLIAITLVALATIASANTLAHIRDKRNLFGDVDPTKVPAMLNNPTFVDAQCRCIVANPTDANTLCDRIGRKLREHLGPSIQKADCPVPCTQQEKEAVVDIIEVIRTKYADCWKKVSDHYKVTPEQSTGLDKWVAEVKTAKG